MTAKLNITGIRKFRTHIAIERQGIPPIPPVVAFIGLSTAVAVTGVAAQTGILAAVLDAISNVISRCPIYNEKLLVVSL